MYDVVLFDLDGTLTESGIGITRSVAYALRKHGIEETDQKKLDRFVGPPLIGAFMQFYGFSQEEAVQAVEDYRAVDERLLSELGRNATLEEIAQGLHMTVDAAAEVAKTMEAARMLAMAKQPQQQEPTSEDEQAVEDTAYFQMRQRIADLLADLDETDGRLLTLRFGLEGGKPLSPEEVGKKLGLTPEEAVAREAAALAKLRER